MKLYKMTYTDSAGVVHIEWFGSKGAASARRVALREDRKAIKARGFTYNQDEIDVPKKKEDLIDFLTTLSGNGEPVWQKGKISAHGDVETSDPDAYVAA